MTFPAILQAGKLRPRGGSDLSETVQSQGKTTLPGEVPYTPAHTLCLEIGQREGNPLHVSLTDFSYLALTTEGFGVCH